MYLIYYDYGVAYSSYLSLFSAASFFFFRRLSPVTEIDEGLFCASLVCIAAAGSLRTIVGICIKLQLSPLFSPKEDATKHSTSKQALVKCSLAEK